ncbi:MAG TPA: carboxypeptidase-like regulatory domain-containing protein [Pyrinomonadaceae bacterium]|nr:carboxypeptidase-like regulatory domain-containing protein [Pyrinomonadaceae bacterium]
MKEPTDVLGRLRVASPCGVGWDSMEGDGRVRFCRLCSLDVYDFSGMTRAEVGALVTKTEGRLCGRLTRRADGTVLTKDCPVGLRAVRLRARRAAGAAFAALLSLCSPAFGQAKSQKLSCPGGGQVNVERKKTESKTAALTGTLLDPAGAVVPNVEVVLKNESTKKEFGATTSEGGEFSVPVLPAGKYTLRVRLTGFGPLVVEHLRLGAGEAVAVKATLGLDNVEELVGVIDASRALDYESGGRKATFSGRILTDLPLGPEE